MPHPLDPLSADELGAAIGALRAAGVLAPGRRLAGLALHEAGKAAAHWSPTAEAPRAALAIVFDPADCVTRECVVTLDDGAVRVRAERDDVQPGFLPGEYEEGIPVVRADPRVRAALAARGIADPERVHVELWPFGGPPPEELAGRRITWAALWHRPDDTDNPYAHPIRGLEVVFDMARQEVVRVVDRGAVPIPDADGRWIAGEVGPVRQAAAPLEVVQPDGPGFTVDGWLVRWQGWSVRLGFNQREALTLHTLAFDDGAGGGPRPIAYRASIAELAIPYADPDAKAHRKSAFDIGEIGLGHYANSLELGCDCLGEIRYLDVHLADDAGGVRTIRNAICLHEEDYGILWKHTDTTTGRSEVRRSRRFVASTIVTVDNYEYAFYWYLYEDGSIEFECKLTGIVLTAALPPGGSSRHGTLLAPGLNAMHHQHVFCARLDLDIDGAANRVHEWHAAFDDEPGIDEDAFVQEARLLATEDEDAGLVDPLRARYWTVTSATAVNPQGRPTGYKLVPGANARSFVRATSPMGRRMAFAQRHVWVTPYDPDERYPAGEYPNLAYEADGLPRWTERRRPIDGEDLVLWYVFTSHHVPRPEDWPVMPVERIGFMLRPCGFWDRTPAIRLPRPPMQCHPG